MIKCDICNKKYKEDSISGYLPMAITKTAYKLYGKKSVFICDKCIKCEKIQTRPLQKKNIETR